MVKYLLASHGSFADGTYSFLKIMCGLTENVYTLNAFLDDQSLDDLVDKKLLEIGEYDQLIIFCDIHGGSVEQKILLKTAEMKNVFIISGFNIPLVLEIISQNRILSEKELKAIIDQARCQINIDHIESLAEGDDDLF